MRTFGLNRTFAALSVAEYRILWFGTLAAFMGFMMSFTAQAVVAFELAGNNRAVGVVALGQGIAMLVIGPFGGVLADRLSKRVLLLGGQAVVGLSFLAAGLLLLTDQLTIALLALTTFSMGTAFSLLGPARQAYVGILVPPRLLPNAVALAQLSQSLTRVVGPFLAGLLIGLRGIGPEGTYLFMAALYIPVLATLSFLPPSHGHGDRSRSVRDDLLAGFHHVRSRPRLRLAMGMFIVLVVVSFPHQVLLPGFLEHELHQPARRIGLLMGVSAAAGFSVGLVLAATAGGRHAWWLMLGLSGVLGLALLGLAVAPSYGAALVAMVPVGIGLSGFMLINNTVILGESEPAYYGRVVSMFMLAFASQNIFSLPMGALADAVGERPTIAATGVAALVVTAVTIGLYARVARAQTAAAAPPAAEVAAEA